MKHTPTKELFAQTEHEKSIAECINLSQKLSPCAHHQYNSVDSNADILPTVFKDCYERTFVLISQYVSRAQLQQGIPSPQIIDIGQTNPQNRSSFELFSSYVNNFFNYQKLDYPYISFVNFRKSLEAFFFENLTAINAHTEKKFILESKQYESLDRLWKEFTKADSNTNKSLSAPQLSYFKTVINGIGDSKPLLNHMCHFHLIRKENKKDVDYLLWDETNADYITFAEQTKEIKLVLEEYEQWFHDIYNTSNPATESEPESTEEPKQETKPDAESTTKPNPTSTTNDRTEEPLAPIPQSKPVAEIQNDSVQKNTTKILLLMLALCFIIIGINIIPTSATQEPSSVSSSKTPALERTRVVTPKTMSASVAKKRFTTNVKVPRLPVEDRNQRFKTSATKALLETARKSNYKSMVGDIEFVEEKPNCDGNTCSWKAQAYFVP